MSFWSTETVKSRLAQLVSPHDERWVKHGAIELSVGPEVCTTADDSKTKKQKLEVGGESAIIHPGQFALLLTEEVVTIPPDAIGFISIRASYKFKGFINVSGFHVDPGYSARLKFSVYNAGSSDIYLSRGERIFMLWYSSIDQETADVYDCSKRTDLNEISSSDQARLQGKVASPSALKEQIDKLQHDYEKRISIAENTVATWKNITVFLLGATVTMVLTVVNIANSIYSKCINLSTEQQKTDRPLERSDHLPVSTSLPTEAPDAAQSESFDAALSSSKSFQTDSGTAHRDHVDKELKKLSNLQEKKEPSAR